MKLDAGQQDALHDFVWNTLEAVSDGRMTVDRARDRFMDAIEASADGVPQLMASIKIDEHPNA